MAEKNYNIPKEKFAFVIADEFRHIGQNVIKIRHLIHEAMYHSQFIIHKLKSDVKKTDTDFKLFFDGEGLAFARNIGNRV